MFYGESGYESLPDPSSGGGYLSIEGDPTPLRIEDGGVLLFPFEHAHSICDELTSPLTRVLQVAYSAHSEYRISPDAGEGSTMVVLCGAFRLEHRGAFPLLHSLPNVIHNISLLSSRDVVRLSHYYQLGRNSDSSSYYYGRPYKLGESVREGSADSFTKPSVGGDAAPSNRPRLPGHPVSVVARPHPQRGAHSES